MRITTLTAICLGGLFCSQLGADDAQPPLRPRPEGTLRLKLRTRVETFKGSGEWDEVSLLKEVPVAQVAIIVCDMWDKHWCDGATERCGALAEKMAPVIMAARAKGIDHTLTLLQMYGHTTPLWREAGVDGVFGYYIPETFRFLRIVNHVIAMR